MARIDISHMLVLVCAVFGFQTSHAQIFIGDKDAPGILWAPLPDPKDDTNILDTTFTLIPLPARPDINDIGYDPGETMVYYCNFGSDQIGRIQLDGTNQQDIISTQSIALDLLNGKIYWTLYNDQSVSWANLDGTSVQSIYRSSIWLQPVAILVDPVNEYLLWSTRITNQVTKAGLNANNDEIVKDVYAEAMINEQCADDTTRLFYYTMASTLGVINLDGSEDETIEVLPNRAGATTLNKYGSKLFWSAKTEFGTPSIYEYDLRSLTLTIHNSTVKLVDGSALTVNPKSIRIFSDVTYDEPVAIQGCPDSIIITLNEGTTSSPVSWAEPVLNSWSSCPKMEFSGNVINGGNVSAGAFELSYMASDAAGNSDACQFSVTVLESGEGATTPALNPVVTARDHSGSGTTIFSFSSILRTLGIAVLFVITIR